MSRSIPVCTFALVTTALISIPTAAVVQESSLESPLSPAQAKTLTGDMYLVFFEEDPLATYKGGIPDLEATAPNARGETKLDAKSPASRAYLAYLDRQQSNHIGAIESRLVRNLKVVFRYSAVANGIATRMTPSEAKIVRGLPGVTRVIHDRVARLDTDRGPTWIGAPGIWDGTDTGGLPGTKGEGVIVGVIDTGVNMDHPSFAATGSDAFTHTNPFGAGVFVGWCDPANPNFDPSYGCNDKLIGAWDYTDAYCAANPATCTEADGPEDSDGHGSHTSSTAAGNFLINPPISGVAPHANLIMYDACYLDSSGQGLCPFSATSAGVDQAVLDGVDATNYSIGGGIDPWGGDIDTFFLNAVEAGVYPAVSAGNEGPGPDTLGHLGPWVSTTAASTHDRDTVENQLINMSGGINPPADITGASYTQGYGPATIVSAGDFANGDPNPEQCLNPFPGGTWTSGEIVLCDRGAIARVLKCAYVQAGGAAGCVLANTSDGQGNPVPDPHAIPAIHVNRSDGTALHSWLASGVGHMATITAGTIILDPASADILADFSSRGPNSSFDVLKPDLAAPGVNILAAVASDGTLPPPEFGIISGTSMSSPHNAGSGALLSALFPGWSPTEIKSALMMSSETTMLKEDGAMPADPFDMGAGRIDLSKAARVGLVLAESPANFLAANPAEGGDPGALNLPSLQSLACVIDCSWTRTVKSVASSTLNWTVTSTVPAGMTLSASPNVFSLASGGTQEIEFSVTPGPLPLDVFAFAELQLTETGGSPDLHMPVAVRPANHNLPEFLSIDTSSTDDSRMLTGVKAASAITDLDIKVDGLVKTVVTDVVLAEDPTNGNPYDDLDQVFVKTVRLSAGTKLFVAATESDESPDVDLYVGTGTTPSAATQICASTSETASERCDVISPATSFHWILVQNWAGSDNQPDAITLTDAALPAGAVGNFDVTGPMSVAAGVPFDLEISWNEPAMAVGDNWLGAFEVGTDPGNPGNIGSVGVVFTVTEGEIFADGFESGDTSAWSSIQ